MNKIKYIVKSIVTNSDILSNIRRSYTAYKGNNEFKKIEKSYNEQEYFLNIERFKNKYLGKRCFIIGNGPSLKAQYLELIKDEYCFAANRVYLMYEKTNWRPTFYMCQDDQILRAEWKNINTFNNVECFISYNPMFKYGIDIPKANIYLADNRDYLKRTLPISFSSKCENKIYDGSTVTYSSMQLAIYMGFKEIYLLGMDHNYAHTIDKNRKISYNPSVKTYFDDTYKDVYKEFEQKSGAIFAVYDFEAVNSAYKQAKNVAEKKGIKIYNATRGGKLEIFERVNFDELINRLNLKREKI